MSKPTFVLVPGAWHSPDIYSAVTAILSKHGFSAMGVALPSVGAIPLHADFREDVAAIRKCLTALISDEKDVVLVVHSYSGLPGGEAPIGVGKIEREAKGLKGLKGGFIRYVVINGFATPAGFQPNPKGDFSQFPEWMKFDHEDATVSVPHADDAKKVFYNDMSSSEGDELAVKLVFQSSGVYFSTATYAAWTAIPSTYLMGEQDETAFSPPMVEMMLQGARQAEPSAFDVVEKCKEGGHCLMISFPEWTADALIRAAGV
ncbi:hypothetical protein HYALB_00012606 [Hymenoscyphus albidus]|uniref:AB hydrolase-1 domain-containing protein n=1 Tax=Hymenoscyphus albidus TaxID=595503 RepID=A0A9N9LNJ1_9HELO|nr:hypothetical protein HYALB_00012606 [Hymenoscyphus albidus]